MSTQANGSSRLRRAARAVTVLSIGGLAVVFAPLSAQAPVAAVASLFTEAQATRGAEVYGAHCAVCHGAELTGGGGAPALSGPDFLFGWSRKSTKDLTDFIANNMPPGESQSLSDQEYEDISAYVLSANGFKAGHTALAPAAPKPIGEPTDTPCSK